MNPSHLPLCQATPVARARRRLTVALALACLVVGLLLVTTGPVHAVSRLSPGLGVWPLRPRPSVVAGFHPPASSYGSGHRGVDLGGTTGQPVHSALAGRVTFASRLAGRGVVVVSHGSTRTTYEPVAATVHVGDRVATGAVIGRLELVGSHCFPRVCLHWGLIEGAEHYLDPLMLVGDAPVRLLPLFTPRFTPRFTSPVALLLRPALGRWPPSGPGVRLPVGTSQPLGGDVRVDLGGGQ